MATDTSKITGAADELSSGLAKGGTAAKTLGAEIANAIKSIDARVAALEGGVVPPVPPDTGGDTDGKIEGFTAATGSNFKIGGTSVSTQNANKPYSLTKVDDYTLRFEHRIGDLWTDGDNTFRSEISWSPHWDTDVAYRLKFKFNVEPGGPNSGWNVLNQIHDTLGVGNSPPYVVELNDDKMKVMVRYQQAGGSVTDKTLFTDSSPITRGRFYAFMVDVRFNPSGGSLKVVRDGTTLANYTGPIGYVGSQYYAKNGIYRTKSATNTIAIVYKNMVLERV